MVLHTNYNISTQYPFTAYTISTIYLLTIYTISRIYLLIIYTISRTYLLTIYTISRIYLHNTYPQVTVGGLQQSRKPELRLQSFSQNGLMPPPAYAAAVDRYRRYYDVEDEKR